MGKLQEFEITFDKNKVVYSPGDSISGTVKIRLGHPLQCKGRSPLNANICAPGGKTLPVAKQGSNEVRITWSVTQAFHTTISLWK